LWWIEEGQYEEKKKQGRGGLCDSQDNLRSFIDLYSKMDATAPGNGGSKSAQALAQDLPAGQAGKKLDRVVVGCDFGSTTAKAVCLSPDRELLFSCYALSKGNPIEDARSLFRQLREVIGDGEILGLGITGYGKDLLKGILGADCGVVETIAHASAGLHYFPDADCICDVGGVD